MATLLQTVAAGLEVSHDKAVVKELLDAYQEAKRNFYLGGLRLSAVAGGRFCEAAFRMLQQRTTGIFDPLGTSLTKTDVLINQLAQLKVGSFPESIRLHITRTLRLIYDIRNKRNTAHLSDGIDPNIQDATLVISCLDWVLAEFVRLYHSVPANEAQKMVDGLVQRQAPVVQDFNGFPKVLKKLIVGEHLLVLLYDRGSSGATFEELESWVRPPMRQNLRRALSRLVNEQDWAHHDGKRYFVTQKGMRVAESKKLLEPE